jgi:hypothetical protein
MQKKPEHRAIRLENALVEIYDAEQVLMRLETAKLSKARASAEVEVSRCA